MALHLVRHAIAVHRGTWPTDDAERPLADEGTRQAHRLEANLRVGDNVLIASSPARRCIDTVSPLARRVGVEVDPKAFLAEGEGTAALEWLRVEKVLHPTRNIVACTHGDVLAALLNALIVEDGLELPEPVRWQEASTWVVQLDDRARAVSARYIPVN